MTPIKSDKAILLVEDNPDDVAFTMRAFIKNDFHNPIVVASDGAEALDLILPEGDRAPLRPCIILLDLNLPKVNGLDVLRRLRAEPSTQSLPVIVLTTSSLDRDIVESYHLGANSYVRKPVMFDDFVKATKVLGMYWLSINQPAPQVR
jgi:two-component system response regulator